MPGCSICGDAVVAKGLCATHYQRMRRTGSMYSRPRTGDLKPLLVRLGADQVQDIKKRAVSAGLDVSELIRRAVDRLLAFEYPDRIAPDGGLASAPTYVREPGNRSHLIYALVDPRDGLPRFVSQTLADQLRPYTASTSPGSHRMRLWMTVLRTAKLRPRPVVLERVAADADANERHEAWVSAAFAVGWPLLQAPPHPMWNYRQDRGRELRKAFKKRRS